MSSIVAILTFLPVFTLAFAHFLWALGYTWPLRSEELLVATVIGTSRARMPSRWATLGIAALLLAASIVAIAIGDPVAGGLSLDLLAAVLGLAFLARGILGYTAAWRAGHPVEPFITLDRRNYSPLCLWVATGFAILIAMRFL